MENGEILLRYSMTFETKRPHRVDNSEKKSIHRVRGLLRKQKNKASLMSIVDVYSVPYLTAAK